MSNTPHVPMDDAHLKNYAANAARGSKAEGTVSGRVLSRALKRDLDRIRRAREAKAEGPIDAVTLALHGSMRVKELGDAEGYLLEELREIDGYLSEFCRLFCCDIDEILSVPFTVVTPDSKDPYRQMYVAN